MLDKMMNLFYNESSCIITQSPEIKNHIINKYQIDKRKIVYIPNTVESSFINLKAKSEINFFENKNFNIVFAGNIGKAQDFETLIKSVKILKDKNLKNINFIIVGDGRDKMRIEKLISKNKLSSFFKITGRYPLSDIPEILSKADALLITLKKSEVFSKTIPAKLQSYMSVGRPILTICDGITSKIINQSNSGFTANSGDYIKFAQNIELIKKLKREELDILGENSKKYFKNNFSRKYVYNKIISLLNDR